MDQVPRYGKRELICLLLFTCNYVVSVWTLFIFLWVLGMGYLVLLWRSLSIPYNYLTNVFRKYIEGEDWNQLNRFKPPINCKYLTILK